MNQRAQGLYHLTNAMSLRLFVCVGRRVVFAHLLATASEGIIWEVVIV
jgi:hypothetical protein